MDVYTILEAQRTKTEQEKSVSASSPISHHIILPIFKPPLIWQSLQTPLPLLVCQVAHSLHISSIMEKKAQLPVHKQVILIGDAFGGLIILREVFIINYFFCFTLRTMFNSSLGGEFKNSPFFFSKIQLLYLLTYFSYLFSIIWLLFVCSFLSFFYFFCVSYELSWCLIMVLRMVGHYVATPEPDPTWLADPNQLGTPGRRLLSNKFI